MITRIVALFIVTSTPGKISLIGKDRDLIKFILVRILIAVYTQKPAAVDSDQ